MTNDEARAFIRRICGELDDGLQEMKQIDEALDAVAIAVVQRIAEAHQSGTAKPEHIERMVELLDGGA